MNQRVTNSSVLLSHLYWHCCGSPRAPLRAVQRCQTHPGRCNFVQTKFQHRTHYLLKMHSFVLLLLLCYIAVVGTLSHPNGPILAVQGQQDDLTARVTLFSDPSSCSGSTAYTDTVQLGKCVAAGTGSFKVSHTQSIATERHCSICANQVLDRNEWRGDCTI
jgi:hypothetical protein